MEEILASIRRIISEDETPAEGAQADAASDDEAEVADSTEDPFPAVEAESEAPADEVAAPAVADQETDQAAPAEDDVLELTDAYEAPAEAVEISEPAESIGDLDVTERPLEDPEPAATAEPEAPPAMPTSYDEPSESIVGDTAAESAASAFAGLTASLKLPSEGRSLEDLVRELMRPLLKDWLDQNLPGIVEEQVRAEVERIARRGAR